MANVQKTFALVLGIVLLAVGVWGFFTDSILGIFGVNALQSVLHVIAGLFGLYVGTSGAGKGYNLTIGGIGIVLAVLGFVSTTAGLLAQYLGINQATTVLHLTIGVVSLLVAYTVKSK